jgi:hypothetical protein
MSGIDNSPTSTYSRSPSGIGYPDATPQESLRHDQEPTLQSLLAGCEQRFTLMRANLIELTELVRMRNALRPSTEVPTTEAELSQLRDNARQIEARLLEARNQASGIQQQQVPPAGVLYEPGTRPPADSRLRRVQQQRRLQRLQVPSPDTNGTMSYVLPRMRPSVSPHPIVRPV